VVDALVLSGGASHGDFEVGAVHRLFEAGFQPALIVAASVGSVNAVTLCQMGTLATADSPSELEQQWLGLTANSSMYTNNPDFDTSAFNQPDLIQQVQNMGLNLQADYTWRLLNSAAAGVAAGATAGSVLGPLGAAGGAAAVLAVGLLSSIFQSGSDLQALMKAAQPLIQDLQNLQKAQSHYTLDPISKALFTDINPFARYVSLRVAPAT
jgi:patatin-like phospholipase